MTNKDFTGVYIMGNHRPTIYVGSTNNLIRRVREHKEGKIKGFTQKYKLNRCLYYEFYETINEAQMRERQMKNMKREEKLLLIKKKNPLLVDIASELFSFVDTPEFVETYYHTITRKEDSGQAGETNTRAKDLVRPNIRKLKPYSCARSEFSGKAKIFLDANENPFGDNRINRYPDPYQLELRTKISEVKNIPVENILCGNGSDELMDQLIRVFCAPGKDNIVICPPTFGMYGVWAEVNDVGIIECPLDADFDLDEEAIIALGEKAKMCFICTPNNPTGNVMSRDRIEKVLKYFAGIVVVDEAYIDFAEEESLATVENFEKFKNLVVLQTFSKYYGLAGARVGMCFAYDEILSYMNKLKAPYNVNALSMHAVLQALDETDFGDQKKILLLEREKLKNAIQGLSFVRNIFSTDANFLFIKVDNADKIYQELLAKGIVIRNFGKRKYLEDCLRISVGTPEENKNIIVELKNLEL